MSELEEQTYGGRTVCFVGDADLTGTVTGDGAGFTVTGEATVTIADRCARCNEPFERPFAFSFEDRFVRQGLDEDRTIDGTLDLAWDLFRSLDLDQITRIDRKYIEKYLKA